MLTGAIDFGGFGSSINKLGSVTGPPQSRQDPKPAHKYQAALDLNEILDDEDEEQSISSHLEHIE